jgi:hypothetical protein
VHRYGTNLIKILLAVFMLFLTATFFTIHHSPTTVAGAQTSTPHIVAGENVWFLNDDGERLFLMPKTYFARINNMDETHFFITFNGLNGKVARDSVSTTGYHLDARGTAVNAFIDGQFADFITNFSLRARPDRLSATAHDVPIRQEFTILGQYPAGNEVWYYVRVLNGANAAFGYVLSERTTVKELTYEPFVPEVLVTANQPPAPEPPTGGGGVFAGANGNAFRILTVIGLCVPVVLILFLLFKPNRNRKYFD